MSNKELKQQIIMYNLSWITTQMLYTNINGVNDKNHASYPEPLQKIIVKQFCQWNLEDNENKSFDFKSNNKNIEMKSTTDESGAASFSKEQLDSDQVIWFYVDYQKSVFIIQKIQVDDTVKKKLREKFEEKASSSIKPIFTPSKNYTPNIETIKINMLTMDVCK